jgi:hypothetical protein
MILFTVNILPRHRAFKLRLFPVWNPICSVVKVLVSISFLFIRSSVTDNPLIRSNVLYSEVYPLGQRLKPLLDKDYVSKL